MAAFDGPVSRLPAVVEPRVSPLPRVGTDAEAAAQEFEAAFLAEMLRHAGFGGREGLMGGGAGETQFAPMFIDAVAAEIARSKPLGIADLVAARLRAAAGEQ
ncbi:MAG: rod-binding protein [Pseudomonadota bacterium]